MIKLIKWIIFYLNIIYKLHSIIHLSSARQSEIVLPNFPTAKTIQIVWPKLSLQDNPDWLTEAYKTILNCLTEWFSARQSLIVCPSMLCQDNEIVWPTGCLQDNLKLSGRMHSVKTIKDCLTEWRSARQSLIVWPNGDCLTELWIVLLALKLSFCCVLCLQGNLRLSCPCYFVFATFNCLVFQLSYKYKCFAYKYGIASFIFKCSFTL